ncbi:hypothetical protein PHMEG_00031408 [Phytophthora megakarya]|uniref:Uncharacterized protein n=1 Tax=Phytophthora megakarya TaxID=4795 RepID=A0A225UY39_9STRA|nr:hypothetical protein PHMEG_00031408 [Phytophthora megakarya]
MAIEALCIMLRRLAYPPRLYEHLLRFGRSRAALSRIFLHMVEHVHDKFAEKIYFAHDLVEKRMVLYCSAVHEKGALFLNPSTVLIFAASAFHASIRAPLAEASGVSATTWRSKMMSSEMLNFLRLGCVVCAEFAAPVEVPDELVSNASGEISATGAASSCQPPAAACSATSRPSPWPCIILAFFLRGM